MYVGNRAFLYQIFPRNKKLTNSHFPLHRSPPQPTETATTSPCHAGPRRSASASALAAGSIVVRTLARRTSSNLSQAFSIFRRHPPFPRAPTAVDRAASSPASSRQPHYRDRRLPSPPSSRRAARASRRPLWRTVVVAVPRRRRVSRRRTVVARDWRSRSSFAAGRRATTKASPSARSSGAMVIALRRTSMLHRLFAAIRRCRRRRLGAGRSCFRWRPVPSSRRRRRRFRRRRSRGRRTSIRRRRSDDPSRKSRTSARTGG